MSLALDIRSALVQFRDILANADKGVAAQLTTLASLGEPAVTAPREYVTRPGNDATPNQPSCTVYLAGPSQADDWLTPQRDELLSLSVEIVAAAADQETAYRAALVYSRAIDMCLTAEAYDAVDGLWWIDIVSRDVRPASESDRNRYAAVVLVDARVRTERKVA